MRSTRSSRRFVSSGNVLDNKEGIEDFRLRIESRLLRERDLVERVRLVKLLIELSDFVNQQNNQSGDNF